MNKNRQLVIEKNAENARDECNVTDYGLKDIFEASEKLRYRTISILLVWKLFRICFDKRFGEDSFFNFFFKLSSFSSRDMTVVYRLFIISIAFMIHLFFKLPLSLLISNT